VRHPAHRRRLLAAIGAITVLAISAGSFAVWSAASPGAKPVPLSTYRNSFMTFRYPATWSPSVWQTTELHFHPMLYLSTQPTHNPCRTSAAVGGGTSITCGAAVGRLAPGGVVVTARVVEHGRGPKIRIGKYKPKSGYRKHTGFRAAVSQVVIESIAAKSTPKRSAKPKPEAAAEEPTAKEEGE